MDSNVKSGWACPRCCSMFEFHDGPPSSGGPLSPFTDESADRMWKKGVDCCCFKLWWAPTLGDYEL